MQQKERAMIIFRCHAIEKGLSLRNVKPGFGVEKMNQLISAIQRYWILYKEDKNTVAFAMSIVDAYFEFQENNNTLDDVLKERYTKLKAQLGDVIIPSKLKGGALLVLKDEIFSHANIPYKEFVMSRHSIRSFTGEPIDEELLRKALEIAEYTPSACNRQPWRNYVYTNKEHVETILTLQTGARQFLKEVGALIIVTSSSAYFYSTEVHQPYLNGGMYSMNLIFALHSLGLGTIPLNMGLSDDKIKAIKECGQILDMDIPVLMIAVGVLPEKFSIAASRRFSYKDYTIFDKQN